MFQKTFLTFIWKRVVFFLQLLLKIKYLIISTWKNKNLLQLKLLTKIKWSIKPIPLQPIFYCEAFFCNFRQFLLYSIDLCFSETCRTFFSFSQRFWHLSQAFLFCSFSLLFFFITFRWQIVHCIIYEKNISHIETPS